jgi:ubiquinone/menaquinone biosynthesis C-methylase UbiE
MSPGQEGFLNPTEAVRVAGIHEGLKIADFGSGSGFFARAAARAVSESGVVWAVDINRELLSRIKNLATAEGLNNVEVLHGDVEVVGGTTLPNESFDFVIAANLLFSIEHRGDCVGEIRRVLKKSGKALVIDWTDSFGGLGPHKDHVFTMAQAQKLFESHGFSVVGKVPAGAYHWGFVVRKKTSQAA